MPAFKWNDTTERMMLIKFLEQNSGLKFDADAAVAAWPDDLEAPTSRGISDRFRQVKRQIANKKVAKSVGQSMSFPSVTNTPQSIPATPRGPPKSSSQASKKVKTVSSAPTSSPDPITTAKGSSKASFKSRLINGNTPHGTKRKRNAKADADDDSEPSMSEHDGSSDSDQQDAVDESPSKTARAASEGRRSLPRRSKSLTPAAYKLATGQDDSETEIKAEKTNGNESKSEDGDGSFDPVKNRLLERDGTSKRKATWEERIAMEDGSADDMQD